MLGSVSWPLLRRAGYRPDSRRRDPVGRRHRRAAVAADARRGGVPDRRVPEDLVPPGARDGDGADAPLLPVDLPDDRSGLAPARDAGRSRRRRASAWALTRQLRLSLHVAGGDCGAAWSAGMSAFRAVFWATVLAVALSFVRRETRADAAAAARRARDRRESACSASRATTATAGIIVGVVTLTGLGLKIAGIIVALAGGHAVPDGRLFGDRGVAARAGGAGHRVVHHRGGDGRAGADAGRRARLSPRTCSSSTTPCSRRSARRPRCRRLPRRRITGRQSRSRR